jgi:hypothetical protein
MPTRSPGHKACVALLAVLSDLQRCNDTHASSECLEDFKKNVWCNMHCCTAPCRRFRNDETERFWEGLRQQVLDRAGLPSTSTVCPTEAAASQRGKGAAQTPQQSAGIVMGVIMAVLLAGVVMLLHKAWAPAAASRQSNSQPAQRMSSKRSRHRSRVVVRSVLTQQSRQHTATSFTTGWHVTGFLFNILHCAGTLWWCVAQPLMIVCPI